MSENDGIVSCPNCGEDFIEGEGETVNGSEYCQDCWETMQDDEDEADDD